MEGTDTGDGFSWPDGTQIFGEEYLRTASKCRTYHSTIASSEFGKLDRTDAGDFGQVRRRSS
jgi:hypothetical protein